MSPTVVSVRLPCIIGTFIIDLFFNLQLLIPLTDYGDNHSIGVNLVTSDSVVCVFQKFALHIDSINSVLKRHYLNVVGNHVGVLL